MNQDNQEEVLIDKRIVRTLIMLNLEAKHYLNTGMGKEYLVQVIKISDEIIKEIKHDIELI